MSIMKIYTYPEKVLKKTAQAVEKIDNPERKLIGDMIDTMKSAEGIGLAANQVGELKRIIVFMSPDEDYQAYVLVNPRITKQEGEVVSEEGCLSFPQLTVKVKRADHVTVVGQDENNKEIELEASGLVSRIIQHEIDHLNGITYIDRLSYFKKRRALKEYLKSK